MALPEKLLSKLVCPACRGKLNYQEKENRLICNECHLAYKIVDNIPILLVDEAEKL